MSLESISSRLSVEADLHTNIRSTDLEVILGEQLLVDIVQCEGHAVSARFG